MTTSEERGKTKVSNGVFGTIKGKFASTSHRVRDKTDQINLRVHEHWHKSTTMPTKTVDEEFEDLVGEFEAMSEACQEIIKFHKHFISESMEVVISSQRIAKSIQILSSLSCFGSTEDHESKVQASLCAITKSYAATMVEIEICLKRSFLVIPQNLDERIKILLTYLNRIYDRVAVRDKALMVHDKIYDKFDNMTILSTTSQFTLKQKQEYSQLERKLVDLKKNYDHHNAILKLELPCFFLLVRDFIGPLMQFLFYVQLTTAYQIQSNIESITRAMNVGLLISTSHHHLPSFHSKLTKITTKVASEAVDNVYPDDGLVLLNTEENNSSVL